METFGERLHDAMIASGVSVNMMAKRCAVSRQTVGTWFRMPAAKLSGVHLLLAAELTQTRPRWLAFGIAPMLTLAPDFERKAKLSSVTS